MKGFNLSTQGAAAGSTGGAASSNTAGGQPNNGGGGGGGHNGGGGGGGAPELGLLLAPRKRIEAEVNATSASSAGGDGGDQSAMGLLRGRSPMTKLVGYLLSLRFQYNRFVKSSVAGKM